MRVDPGLSALERPRRPPQHSCDSRFYIDTLNTGFEGGEGIRIMELPTFASLFPGLKDSGSKDDGNRPPSITAAEVTPVAEPAHPLGDAMSAAGSQQPTDRLNLTGKREMTSCLCVGPCDDPTGHVPLPSAGSEGANPPASVTANNRDGDSLSIRTPVGSSGQPPSDANWMEQVTGALHQGPPSP